MDKKLYYKGVRVNAIGVPILFERGKKTPKRKERKRDYYHNSFNSPFKKNSPKNLIVMYDIPHELKKERDWFRRHLKKFGYSMIQKSVWVGPSPLPVKFTAYLKRIGLQKEFKTFKLAKSYIS